MKKQKYRLQKDLTLLTSSFFILVVIWISFSIYHTHTTSTVSDVLQIRIQPINGKFDTLTIDKLKKKLPVSPEFSSPFSTESARNIDTNIASPTPTETPEPTVEPIPVPTGASETPEPTQSQEVTP